MRMRMRMRLRIMLSILCVYVWRIPVEGLTMMSVIPTGRRTVIRHLRRHTDTSLAPSATAPIVSRLRTRGEHAAAAACIVTGVSRDRRRDDPLGATRSKRLGTRQGSDRGCWRKLHRGKGFARAAAVVARVFALRRIVYWHLRRRMMTDRQVLLRGLGRWKAARFSGNDRVHVRLANLLANVGRALPQRLRRLVPGLLIANVRPQPRPLVLLQEPSPLRSDGFHDAPRQERLAPLAGVDVLHLVIFDPLAILLVARVMIRPPAAAAQHIVVVRHEDVLHHRLFVAAPLLLLLLLLRVGRGRRRQSGRSRRRIAAARHNPRRVGK
mmetsp:Transcript_6914/g.19440  ORF Transcript_6914/g.19440 Transcript_6914/m.19440 type:complete len:324 (+) Transcript_6914:1-972(+)